MDVISKSKRGVSNLIIYVLGILMCIGFIYLVNSSETEVIYDEHKKIVGIILLILIILVILFQIFNHKKILVYDTFFEVKTVFSTKKYNFTDVKTYFYTHNYRSFYTKFRIIFKNDDKIALIDSDYSNFYVFFEKIKIRKNTWLNKKLERKIDLKYAVFFGFIAFLFLLLLLFVLFEPFKNNDNDVVEFTDVITSVQHKKSAKNSNKVVMTTKNHPIFNFGITGVHYDNLTVDFLKIKNDSLKIGISKSDFEKKIMKSEKLTFFDKYFDYRGIDVKSIQNFQGQNYINLKQVSQNQKSDKYVVVGILLFFIIMLSFFAIAFYKQ